MEGQPGSKGKKKLEGLPLLGPDFWQVVFLKSPGTGVKGPGFPNKVKKGWIGIWPKVLLRTFLEFLEAGFLIKGGALRVSPRGGNLLFPNFSGV